MPINFHHKRIHIITNLNYFDIKTRLCFHLLGHKKQLLLLFYIVDNKKLYYNFPFFLTFLINLKEYITSKLRKPAVLYV